MGSLKRVNNLYCLVEEERKSREEERGNVVLRGDGLRQQQGKREDNCDRDCSSQRSPAITIFYSAFKKHSRTRLGFGA